MNAFECGAQVHCTGRSPEETSRGLSIFLVVITKRPKILLESLGDETRSSGERSAAMFADARSSESVDGKGGD